MNDFNLESLGQDGEDFICAREGFKSCPFLDSEGVPTVGCGTTIYPDGRRVTMQDECVTEAQALEYMHDYVGIIFYWMNNYLKWKPNHNQLIALTSFLYNTGVGTRFNSYVNTKKAIISGDLAGICEGMKSVNNRGLLDKRRQFEVEMFNKKAVA